MMRSGVTVGVYGRPFGDAWSATRRRRAARGARGSRGSRPSRRRRLDERQPQAADLVAEQLERRLDRDRVRLDPRSSIAGRSSSSSARAPSTSPSRYRVIISFTRRPDDVRVDADAADAADLEERKHEVVVAGVEVEAARRRCAALRRGRRLRLLDGADVRDLGEPRDRLGLDVDHHAARDVVDDHRPVGGSRDRLEVRDDPALRRLVVVRRHDEEAVDAERVRLLGEVHGVGGRVRARAGDDRRAPADRRRRRRRRARSARRRRASATRRSCR